MFRTLLSASLRTSASKASTAQLLKNSQHLLHTSSRANSSIINIQDAEDFTARVLESPLPIVVDFHASWCGPCKILGPRLEALIAAHGEGKVIMAKVDIDELSDIAVDHGVEAVPTVLAVKGGQVVDKFVGVKDNDQLEAFINKLIGK